MATKAVAANNKIPLLAILKMILFVMRKIEFTKFKLLFLFFDVGKISSTFAFGKELNFIFTWDYWEKSSNLTSLFST